MFEVWYEYTSWEYPWLLDDKVLYITIPWWDQTLDNCNKLCRLQLKF